MSETTLKEIPVQILSLAEDDILVLRVPSDWTDEDRWWKALQPLTEALEQAGKRNAVVVLPDDVSLAQVKAS